VPSYYGTLRRTSITLDERINNTTWKVIAKFETVGSTTTEENEASFSFDTGGGTQHITQSLDTRGKYGPAASDVLGGAIGFDGENVAGVDITVPLFNFSETHYLPDEVVNQSYKMRLFRKTGMYNNDSFRGFDPGEVLFLGASGSRRGDGDWEISFRFSASQNQKNIKVGEITVPEKRGWDYLWVQYADDVDDNKKQIVKKPVAAYVEKVYYGTDFTSLGIGN